MPHQKVKSSIEIGISILRQALTYTSWSVIDGALRWAFKRGGYTTSLLGPDRYKHWSARGGWRVGYANQADELSCSGSRWGKEGEGVRSGIARRSIPALWDRETKRSTIECFMQATAEPKGGRMKTLQPDCSDSENTSKQPVLVVMTRQETGSFSSA